MSVTSRVEGENRPLLSARQVGVAAAFGGAVTKSTKGSAAGFNAGIDVTWLFAESVGIGGIVRYTRADVDLKAVEGRSLTMKAGGLQGAVGIRVRF